MVIEWAKAQGYYEGEDPVELAEQALPVSNPLGSISSLPPMRSCLK